VSIQKMSTVSQTANASPATISSERVRIAVFYMGKRFCSRFPAHGCSVVV
jgi:hypothetical protein